MHLAQTIRHNFPDNRSSFHAALLDETSPDNDKKPGERLEGPDKIRHLRITDSEESTVISTIANNEEEPKTKFALVSTIQFVAALQRLKEDLSVTDEARAGSGWKGYYETTIPRSKPLSPGEILGCTAPKLEDDVDALMLVHLCIFAIKLTPSPDT